jgi:hypothetical protein
MIYPVPMLGARLPKVSSGYRGSRPDHVGVDVMFRKEPGDPEGLPTSSPGHYMPSGHPAVAWRPGKVILSSDLPKGGRVRIDHGGGLWSAYYHLARRDVSEGDTVKAGERIGTIGHGKTAANPSGYPLNHLHFEIYQHGSRVNPASYLSSAKIIEKPPEYRWLIYGGIAVGLGLLAARFIR